MVPVVSQAADARRSQGTRSHERMTRFFEVAPDPMCVIGFDGYFKRVNEAWRRLLGFSPEALEEQPVLYFVHPDDRAAFARAEAALRLSGVPAQLDVRFCCLSGGYKQLVWHGAADLEEGCVYATVREAAEPKQTLRQYTETAGTVKACCLAEREAAVRTAGRNLEEPARLVTSYLQLLARRCEGEIDEETQRFVGIAVDAARHLQRLIRSLPAASYRGPTTTPVAMEAVLDRALQVMGPALERAGARVTHDALPTVMGNLEQLAELLQHLLANAVTFRRPDVPLWVHVGVKRQGEQWHFSVEDNGAGMSPAHRERLFARLQQPHADEGDAMNGGLTRCKQIVERHRGRIGVESKLWEGSSFYFTLDAA